VMLRPDGYAKVLDFGLAKLTEAAAPAVAAEAPTVQVRTQSGIVMGTAGYMSPEQARGLTVDGRSDIFSLGAVIYEMVANRKPFEGDTPSDILASILKTEPTPLSRVVTHVPAELNRIVTKALRKDREERYQVVKDLLLDLKALKQELDFQTKLQGSSAEDPYHTEVAENVITNATKRQTIDTRTALSSISDSLSLEIKQHKVRTAALLVGLLLVAALGAWAIYRMVHKEERVEHFSDIKLSRLTNSGNVIDALISPDGKYMVYVLSDRSSQSLWIRQVSTANDKEVLPAAPVGFFGLAFSPDGTELFYAVKADLDAGTLYRIPVLGGIPSKVLEKIDTPISFSPDEKRFVLIRANYPNQGESALVIANSDGTGERVLATRKLPERFSPIFFTGPAWSPDGKLIAATVATVGAHSRVSVFDVADGKERVLTRDGWPFAARVEWLRDMSGLIVVAGDNPGLSQQWIVRYPSGERRQVTNDLNTYRTIGLTKDGQKFSTVQAEGLVNLWVVPNGDAAKATRLPTGNFGFYAGYGNSLSWTPDDRVVFVSNEDGGPDIWIMQPNGQNRKQLTSNDTTNVSPSVSVDGKLILFVSVQAGARNIWRMNIDGSNPIRLTNGLADNYPSFSPDGKWVIYSKLEGPIPTVWKVSVDGGEPVQLTSHIANAAQISPDGKLLAYAYPDSSDPYAPSNRIDLVDLASGSVVRTLKLAINSFIGSAFQWAPDGKSLHFVANASNVSNIWNQPIDGGPAKPLTDFKELLISGFAWSRDGKILVCSRGQLIRDAVLITEVK
jgi:Tol biopolymer transport system component